MQFTKRVILPLVLACGAGIVAVATPAAAPAGDEDMALSYEPGGMWMPQQIADVHADTLRNMGLAIDPQVFADPLQFPLNAIISLGGCSASFISPQGLIITNYHCVRGYLQFNSTEQDNLLHTGFLAGDRAQERSAGPTARVYVTTAVTDVTERMLRGIAEIRDDWERFQELERREKALVRECETGQPDSRCEVARFYGGGKFYLITRLEIRDVRLVYAPHRGIGEFGGDIDNWMWPRHTGDFSLLRAYVGKDGKPADYSQENIPFNPKAYLRVATGGLQPGDLAFVVGYPGSTERLASAMETQSDVAWYMPRSIGLFQKIIDRLHEVSDGDEDLGIKAAGLFAGLENTKKNFQGVLEGVARKDLVREKFRQEKNLQKWIRTARDRREKYGDVIPAIDALFTEYYRTRETDLVLRYLGSGFLCPLVNSAYTIIRMAEERPRPDMERDPDYQERNWKRLEQAQVQLQQTYSREIALALMTLILQEGLSLPADERPELLVSMFGKGGVSGEAIRNRVLAMLEGTGLEDQATRVRLLNHATLEELRQSEDPLIRFGLQLTPYLEALKEKRERLSGALVLHRPGYYYALEEMHAGLIAPDANGTIRVSFGTVRGFQPSADAETWYPFTGVWQVAEKWARNRGEPPFDAPRPLLDAIQEQRFGPYVFADTGQVPVNVLTDLDITGGNSGSATLNNRAEFAGIAFDGNIEGVASDLLFLPDLTRAIHVDIRYILWILDAVEHADHLLREMGVTPAFQAQ